MNEKFSEYKSLKDLMDGEIKLEHRRKLLKLSEKAYRRGYRDAILILSQDNESLSKKRLYRIYEWAFDGDLEDWQSCIRDDENPDFDIAPAFPR